MIFSNLRISIISTSSNYIHDDLCELVSKLFRCIIVCQILCPMQVSIVLSKFLRCMKFFYFGTMSQVWKSATYNWPDVMKHANLDGGSSQWNFHYKINDFFVTVRTITKNKETITKKVENYHEKRITESFLWRFTVQLLQKYFLWPFMVVHYMLRLNDKIFVMVPNCHKMNIWM